MRLRKILPMLVFGLVALVIWLERRAQAERRLASEQATDAGAADTTPEGTTQPDAASSEQEARLYAAEGAEPPMAMAPPTAMSTEVATPAEAEAAESGESPTASETVAEAGQAAETEAETATETVVGQEPTSGSEPGPETTGQGWVKGDGTRECPASFPIKGNANSMIYHQPGESSYDVTIPEICFATEDDAKAAGYRPRRH